jgi:cytidylate kinase
MSVIAISRGTLSGAAQLSRALADTLGYRLVMREEVFEAARVYGIAESGLGVVGLADDAPPGFWHRFSSGRQLYLACFAAALLDVALGDNVIYVGHFAHLLLKGYPRVLRVRLAAPDAYRVARLQEEREVDRREALKIIRDVDDRRLKWGQFLYGVDWRDPAQYDLVINPEKIDLATAARIVTDAAASAGFQPGPADLAILRNLRLAAVARVALLRSLQAGASDLQVAADAGTGTVTVTGNPPGLVQEVWEQEIRAAVSPVDGVAAVIVLHGSATVTE